MSRALSSCAEPGCPRLLAPGERCPEHEAPFATSTYRQRRAIPEHLRRRILARDRHRCVLCGRRAAHVDHVVPRHLGGNDSPANLAALCRRCHQRKTSREANRARHR